MRRANDAIKRERHMIPKLEEILPELNGAKLFSKLDLTEAYHQLELDEKSRDITTFGCHKGLFRSKRLVYGVNSAFESFQKQVESVIAHIEGCKNISDDIFIWAKNIEEHDRRLEAVLTALEESQPKQMYLCCKQNNLQWLHNLRARFVARSLES